MSDAICRCCLTQGCYKDIATEYYFNGKTEVYADMLKDTFDLTLSNSNKDTLNRKRFICNSCITRLRDATDFKRQVQECDIIFNEQFKDNGTSSDQIIMEIKPLVKQEKIDHEEYPDMTDHCGDDADHDIGYDDDDDDDLDDDVPLSKRAKKNVKKELEIEKTITVEYNPSILETILTTDDTPKPTSEVKEKTKKKPSTSKAAKGESSKAKRVIKVVRKQEVKKKGDESGAVETNAETILQYSTVYPFFILKGHISCCFCSDTFEDPNLFRAHMDEDHKSVNTVGALKNKKFKSRVDITNNRCKICNVKFESFYSLLHHLLTVHLIDVDLSKENGLVPMKLRLNRFECILCDKKFSGITELNRHTAQYRLGNNICEQCDKTFQTNFALKRHIATSHTDKHVCRTCKAAYDTFEEKKEHMLQNYRCLPNSCIHCKQRFLTYETKQKHLQEVHGIERAPNQCKECGQEFRTRTILYIHFRNAHTDTLKCTECDKKFQVRRDYDAHMFAHNGEAPYQCNVCLKRFRSKNNLRRHATIHDKETTILSEQSLWEEGLAP